MSGHNALRIVGNLRVDEYIDGAYSTQHSDEDSSPLVPCSLHMVFESVINLSTSFSSYRWSEDKNEHGVCLIS